MVIAKPSFFDRFTSRKFLLALAAFVGPGLGGLLGYLQTPEIAKDLGIAAPIIYLLVQGAIDWIKTKKVYEAQAAAAVSGALPAVVGASTSGPNPHTMIAVDSEAAPAA